MSSRSGTKTQSFGSSRREGHDAQPFYSRFEAASQTADSALAPGGRALNRIWTGDARDMDACSGGLLRDNTVALVVTSPPYFAGKEYELDLGAAGIPGSYAEYLDMLEAVFAECRRKLEPGGRIAVNVANLGRKPYRSLSAEVLRILEHLEFLPRGEIIWAKGKSQSGSCAWGSFQSAANPVLRDLTERIIVASKGRFDRARSRADRRKAGLPSENTINRDAFMAYTTDVWQFAPESARRVGHPAPFPVELPRRLIELYTYRGDLVLDPFMGAGATALAALETQRSYAGFELSSDYAAAARERISAAMTQEAVECLPQPHRGGIAAAADMAAREVAALFTEQGLGARQLAMHTLRVCGFNVLEAPKRFRGVGVEVDALVEARNGNLYNVDVCGSFSGESRDLRDADSLWGTLGKACVLHEVGESRTAPYLVLATRVPRSGTPTCKALAAATGPDRPIAAALELQNPEDFRTLWNLGGGSDYRDPQSLQK